MVSKSENFDPSDATKLESLEAALEEAYKIETDEIFIIGGASVYKQAMSFSTHMYLTYVDGSFEGDSFFPEFGSEWEMVKEDPRKADEKNQYDFTFTTYRNINALGENR